MDLDYCGELESQVEKQEAIIEALQLSIEEKDETICALIHDNDELISKLSWRNARKKEHQIKLVPIYVGLFWVLVIVVSLFV